MASINFLYRSIKENAPLTIRLLFRHDDKDYVLGAKTELYIYSYAELQNNSKLSAKRYWKELHLKKKVKDIELANKQVEVSNKLNAIENYVLRAFSDSKIDEVIETKDWLKDTLEEFYRPKVQETDFPLDLVSFFDYYINKRREEVSESHIKTLNVTKNKLAKFDIYKGYKVKISNINEDFKNEFAQYSTEKKYSRNTQQKDLKLIKIVCRYARYLGLEIHPQMDALKLPNEAAKNIYLTFDELKVIKELTLKQEYLDNARDWLLISCYTGQRVSDFMRFKPDMIREESGKFLLEFKQVKTKKQMVVPVSREVRDILRKRNGEFPRPISDQKYNEYIKVVCQLAEINEICEGKKRESIAPEGVKPTKNDYRDIVGKFEKWELVSSHIGRRSFATNHYGKVPTTFLIYITGHSSEKMFLNYIKKSNKDLALESYKYFD